MVCRLYNNYNFSISLGAMGFGLRLLSSIFSFIHFIFSSKQESLDIIQMNLPNTTNNLEAPQNNSFVNAAYQNEICPSNNEQNKSNNENK